MPLIIELTPEQEARLSAIACQEGIAPSELARKLVTEHLPQMQTETEETDPTLALFTQWEKEDANKTPEEIEQERRVWEEFEKGINATRQAQEMRQL